jgi:Fur family ferric uptake transcriptional regulator
LGLTVASSSWDHWVLHLGTNGVQRITEKNLEFDWFWQKLDKYLSDQDLKQTKQRRVIVEHFLTLNSHIDAETLYESIRSSNQNIGLATIYRTLNLLKSAGLVEEQSFADGRAVYEIDRPGDHHDHLVCIDCRKVVEFENLTIEKLQREIASQNGFKLESHRLDLYGRCSDCMGKLD